MNSDDSSNAEKAEIESLRGGGEQALAALFSRYRPQLNTNILKSTIYQFLPASSDGLPAVNGCL